MAHGSLGVAFLTDERGGEILRVVDGPHGFAIGGRETNQLAPARLRINPAFRCHRRAARRGGSLRVREGLIDDGFPPFGA